MATLAGKQRADWTRPVCDLLHDVCRGMVKVGLQNFVDELSPLLYVEMI